MSRRLCSLAFIVLLLVVEPACRKKKVAVPLPNPPAPAAKAPEAAEEKPAPSPETAPAPISTAPAQPSPYPPAAPSTPTPKSEGPGTRYQVNRPAQQTQPARKPSRSAPATATPGQPAPGSAPPTAPVAPAPQLGDILTPEQQREYNAAIDQSLAGAQTSLGSIANRQLSKEQQAILGQIRSFIQQAQETRKSDLQGAKSLAERAEVLARDLAASFR